MVRLHSSQQQATKLIALKLPCVKISFVFIYIPFQKITLLDMIGDYYAMITMTIINANKIER